VLTSNCIDLRVTQTFIHMWNDKCSYSPAAERQRSSAGTQFHPTEDRRLSWLKNVLLFHLPHGRGMSQTNILLTNSGEQEE